MQIIISGRHVDLAEDLREHIEERFRRLTKFDGRVSRIEVTLKEEKNRCAVEANLSVRRGTAIHARAEAPEFRTAVDRLYEKLSRQLKKNRSRGRERKGKNGEPQVATEEMDT
jgi:ribosome-associated inhibitor A